MSAFALVSVIVPGLNEAPSLPELFARIEAVMVAQGQPWEFIFVDDGSTDHTIEVLEGLRQNHPQVGYVRHFRNHGKSMALMQGFDLARGEVVVTLDADLQDQPEDIPAFLNKLEQGYDCVNGWRHQRKDTLGKRFVSRLYNGLIQHLFRVRVHDINCGFKAMRRDVYKHLVLRGDLHRLIPVLAAGWSFRVAEVPVRHEDRKYGSSRYKLLRFRGILDIITLMVSNTSQLRPFHVFTEVSFLFWGIFALLLAVHQTLQTASGWGNALLLVGMAWSLLMASLLPLFGLLLEVVSTLSQGREWRNFFIKAQVAPATIRTPEAS